MISESRNLHFDELCRYAILSLKLTDVFFLLASIILAFACHKTRKTIARQSVYIAVSPLIIGTMFYLAGVFSLFKNPHIPTTRDWNGANFIPMEAQKMTSPILCDYKVGLVRGEILYGLKHLFISDKLSEEDISDIKEFISAKRPYFAYNIDIPKHKQNVIFILCESYISVTSDLVVDGKEITPFLNSLKKEPETFYNGNVTSNVNLGESADGQMIYLTGLLPLKEELTTPYLKDCKIPSLARALKNRRYKTIMTIPTDKTIWGQEQTCKDYGIDSLFSTDNLGIRDGRWLNDKEVLEYAFRNDERQSSPYFHIVLTCTNHSPYDKTKPETVTCKCRPREFPKSYTEEFCNYLLDCHFMDHQIAEYIANFKKRGTYNNTLIVIVSDHGVKEQYLNQAKSLYGNNALPFYICNTGKRWDTKWGTCQMNQIDIFPTLLDLLGINQEWRGIGNSIFNNEYEYIPIGDEEQTISSKIVRGRYMK